MKQIATGSVEPGSGTLSTHPSVTATPPATSAAAAVGAGVSVAVTGAAAAGAASPVEVRSAPRASTNRDVMPAQPTHPEKVTQVRSTDLRRG